MRWDKGSIAKISQKVLVLHRRFTCQVNLPSANFSEITWTLLIMKVIQWHFETINHFLTETSLKNIVVEDMMIYSLSYVHLQYSSPSMSLRVCISVKSLQPGWNFISQKAYCSNPTAWTENKRIVAGISGFLVIAPTLHNFVKGFWWAHERDLEKE